MSLRSLLIASAAALSLAALATSASACGDFEPQFAADGTASVQVAQTDPAPASAATSSTETDTLAPATDADDPND